MALPRLWKRQLARTTRLRDWARRRTAVPIAIAALAISHERTEKTLRASGSPPSSYALPHNNAPRLITTEIRPFCIPYHAWPIFFWPILPLGES